MRKILFEETKDDVKLMIRNLGCKKGKPGYAWCGAGQEVLELDIFVMTGGNFSNIGSAECLCMFDREDDIKKTLESRMVLFYPEVHDKADDLAKMKNTAQIRNLLDMVSHLIFVRTK